MPHVGRVAPAAAAAIDLRRAQGRTDEATELLQELLLESVRASGRGGPDPCGAEFLEPLRRAETHAHLFAHCPARL